MPRYVSSKNLKREEKSLINGLSLELSNNKDLRSFFDIILKEYQRSMVDYEKSLKKTERQYSTFKMPNFHKVCDLLKTKNLTFTNPTDYGTRRKIIIRNKSSIGDLVSSISIINNNSGNNLLTEVNYIIDATDKDDNHIYLRIMETIKNSLSLKKSEKEHYIEEVDKANKYVDNISFELIELEKKFFKTKKTKDKIAFKKRDINKQRSLIYDYAKRIEICDIDIKALKLLLLVFNQEKELFVESIKELTERLILRKRIEDSKKTNINDVKREVLMHTYDKLISNNKFTKDDIENISSILKSIFKKSNEGEYDNSQTDSIIKGEEFEYLTICQLLAESKKKLDISMDLSRFLNDINLNTKSVRIKEK